jgi:homoserine kinase type II
MDKYLVCGACPNGCNLELIWTDEAHVVVARNKCSRGIGYAHRMLGKERKVFITAKEQMPSISLTTLKELGQCWGKKVAKPRYDICVQGSPERSAFRVVFEDEAQDLFVLEQLFLKTLTAKQNIAKTLQFLDGRGLKRINPYLLNSSGEAVVKYKTGFWQLADFVDGVELDRPAYVFDAWRGLALARFLVDLREKAQELPSFGGKKIFSLKDYVYRLVKNIETYHSAIHKEVSFVMDFLEGDLMGSYQAMPVVFCHGDYHPMNMIWAQKNIRCVIDWEFSGYKNEIYDMANLIGCVGIEDPSALQGGLVQSFVGEIRASGIISTESWPLLLDFVVALRFAWLSEWLRRCDEEMIALELEYMRLLIENKQSLRVSWGF